MLLFARLLFFLAWVQLLFAFFLVLFVGLNLILISFFLNLVLFLSLSGLFLFDIWLVSLFFHLGLLWITSTRSFLCFWLRVLIWLVLENLWQIHSILGLICLFLWPWVLFCVLHLFHHFLCNQVVNQVVQLLLFTINKVSNQILNVIYFQHFPAIFRILELIIEVLWLDDFVKLSVRTSGEKWIQSQLVLLLSLNLIFLTVVITSQGGHSFLFFHLVVFVNLLHHDPFTSELLQVVLFLRIQHLFPMLSRNVPKLNSALIVNYVGKVFLSFSTSLLWSRRET